MKKQEFYISYLTHSYCRKCEIWVNKQEWDGKYCTMCKYQLRKHSRFNKKEDRWDNAY